MSLHDSLIVIARLLFTVIASGAWQSAKGGVATRYSSDEAARSRGKLDDRDNYDYQK